MSTALARTDIARLVHAFYARIRQDALLGPIFASRVHDWAQHEATLVQFWSSVMLGTREYRGNPMALHRALPITDTHFGHWLALWQQTAVAELGAEKAEPLHEAARRIAQSLRYGLGLERRQRLPVLPAE